MKDAIRARVAWLLAAAATAFGLVNVLVYYETGTFGAQWLVASVVLYTLVLVGALVLAFTDKGVAPPERGAQPTAPGEPKLVERIVTYRTRAGMAVRLVYLWPDGTEERRHVTFTATESLPLHDVEAQLDAFPAAREPEGMDAGIEAALRRHAWEPRPPEGV